MNEDILNASLRRFLKTVGITSQREIENAIRKAAGDGHIKGKKVLRAQMVLTINDIGLNHKVEGNIEVD